MSRLEKSRARLAVLEREFLAALTPSLKQAAAGRETGLFLPESLSPWPQLVNRLGKASSLAAAAHEIVKLREQLAELDAECPASLYLRHCAEACDLSDEHRLGDRRRAERFLARLGRPNQA